MQPVSRSDFMRQSEKMMQCETGADGADAGGGGRAGGAARGGAGRRGGGLQHNHDVITIIIDLEKERRNITE